MTEASSLPSAKGSLVHIRGGYHKISKVGAGYVFRPGTEYRCKDCWKFIPGSEQCAEIASIREIKPGGYCILWSKGEPRHQQVFGNYTVEEVGYGELPNGTLCRRCEHFDGAHSCEIVEGEIKHGACCDNQQPK
jgi:hypothetical protein